MYLERSYNTCEEGSAPSISKPNWKSVISSITTKSSTGATADEFILEKFADRNENGRRELLATDDSNGMKFVQSALWVLEGVTDTNVLLYTLELLESFLIVDVEQRSKYFLAGGDKKVFKLDSFLKLLNHSSPGVAGRGAYMSCLLLSKIPEPNSSVSTVIDFISGNINKTIEVLHKQHMNMFAVAETHLANIPHGFSGSMLSLTVLLRNLAARVMFVDEHEDSESIKMLFESVNLTLKTSMTTLYNLMLCIWQLSFDLNIRRTAFGAPEMNTLVAVLKTEPFEKVVRLCLHIMRSVMEEKDNQAKLSEALISLNMMKLIDSLKAKKGLLKDQDLSADLNWIQSALIANYKVLTTFDRHEKELDTNQLSWSTTVHSDAFWKENALQFEKNNFASIKKLVQLLSSPDPVTTAVACYDLGEFVQYYPNGKLIVEGFGGKQQIMGLLQHDAPEVQKQALTACSKLMINNWRSVVAK